jgi:hypothetical protein
MSISKGKKAMTNLLTFFVFALPLGIVAAVVSARWPKDWGRLLVTEIAIGMVTGMLVALF